MSRWGPQLAEGTKCRRPFGQAFEYWVTQEASHLLEVNYAVSQGTIFQAIPGRSLSWLPRFPPQTNVELHISEICLVECQPVGSFICLFLIVIILEQQSQKLYFKATVPQRIPGKLATYIYLEGNFRDLSLQVKKRFSQLHKSWHNPTLYVSFPGCFIKGESWLMDQNVRFCAKGTRAALCRKLKEGLRAMICTAVSKPSQERYGKSSLRNWSQVASQGSFYQRKERGWVVGRGVFPNLQCCLYEEGGCRFLVH